MQQIFEHLHTPLFAYMQFIKLKYKHYREYQDPLTLFLVNNVIDRNIRYVYENVHGWIELESS